eukprot:2661968-Prymnesium_polylepis.1
MGSHGVAWGSHGVTWVRRRCAPLRPWAAPPHLREAVEERLRETLAAAALLQRVLAAEDAEAGRTVEGGAELRDVDGRAVVEAGVEALEDRLWRQVELVEYHPVAAAHRCEEGAVLPAVGAGGGALDGQ